MRRLAFPFVLFTALACSEPVAPSARPVEKPSEPGASPTARSPEEATPNAPAAIPVPSKPPTAALPKAPERGCVMGQEVTVREGPARFAVGSDGARVLLASAPAAGRTLEWWSGAWGALERRAELSLDAPVAQLALFHREPRTELAFIDDKARLYLVELEHDRFGTPRRLAEGVDRRFAPSLARLGEKLGVTFTRTEKEVMHTFLARVGSQVQLEDLTPPGHGAAAASFLLGVSTPSLVMLDAHAGVSPFLEITFDAEGRAQPAVVRTPVSQPYAPPALAAVGLSPEHAEVAFTAIGRVAATAIGRVPLRRAEAPVALVPSKGYGALHLSAAAGPGFAVFALESFKQASNDPARELVIKLVDERGEGSGLELRSETDSLALPALTQGASAGEYWLAFMRGKQLELARLACGR